MGFCAPARLSEQPEAVCWYRMLTVWTSELQPRLQRPDQVQPGLTVSETWLDSPPWLVTINP